MADRWANELADKGLTGTINVADGLMKVTLDAYVLSLQALYWIRAHLLSQYWFWHVIISLEDIGLAHWGWSPTAAFDHDFGAVTDSDDPLMKSYSDLM